MAHGAHSSEHRSVGMSGQSGTCRVFGTGRKNEQKKKKKNSAKKNWNILSAYSYFVKIKLFTSIN